MKIRPRVAEKWRYGYNPSHRNDYQPVDFLVLGFFKDSYGEVIVRMKYLNDSYMNPLLIALKQWESNWSHHFTRIN